MNRLLCILFFLLIICYTDLHAQIKTQLNSKIKIDGHGKYNKQYDSSVNFYKDAKSIQDVLRKNKVVADEDSPSDGKIYKHAHPIAVDLNIAKKLKWKYDGILAYGKFTIKLKDAKSLSLNFNQFFLPAGTEMYVYNQDGEMIQGEITPSENNESKSWGTWVYKGDKIVIELKIPVNKKSELLLNVNNIAYGYKEIYQTQQIGGFGQSSNCNINVLCSLGTGWEPERNSVAHCLSGDGSGFFSGSLLMNTCNTASAYFLTANHAFEHATPVRNVSNWRFIFQAWSSTCPNPGVNTNGVTFNGSTLRANWAGSDFCLVQLTSMPASNSGIHYAGWNRNVTGINQVSILHHPRGDLMKITRDNDAPQSVVHPDISGLQCWQSVVEFGATEPGSSGSPYFDQNHRVIGQHYGGSVSQLSLPTCDQITKFAGRFDVSWTGGGTNATRLSNWLDPSGSNAMTTNTTNASNLLRVPVEHHYGIVGTGLPCINSATTYQIGVNTLPSGASVAWSVFPNDGTVGLSSTTGSSTDIIPNNPALNQPYYLQADITMAGCTYPIYKNISFQAANWNGSIIGMQGWWNTIYSGPLVEGDNYFYTGGGVNYFEVWNEGVTEYTNSGYWEYIGGTQANYTGPHFIGFDLAVLGGSVDANYNYHFTDECGSHSVPYHFENTNSYPPSFRTQNTTTIQPYQLKISPNPAVNIANISVIEVDAHKKADSKTFDYSTQKTIRVYDKLGTLLFQRNEIVPKSGLRLNVSSLKSNDIYSIIVEDENGLRLSGKIIKQ